MNDMWRRLTRQCLLIAHQPFHAYRYFCMSRLILTMLLHTMRTCSTIVFVCGFLTVIGLRLSEGSSHTFSTTNFNSFHYHIQCPLHMDSSLTIICQTHVLYADNLYIITSTISSPLHIFCISIMVGFMISNHEKKHRSVLSLERVRC